MHQDVVYVARTVLIYRAKFLAELAARVGSLAVVASDAQVDTASKQLLAERGVTTNLLSGEWVLNDNTYRASPWFRLLIQPGLFKAVLTMRPKVLIIEGFGYWSLPALVCKFFFGSKVLISWERTAHTERNNGRLKNTYYRMFMKAADAYLANGTETREMLASFGVPAGKINSPNFTAYIEPLVDMSSREAQPVPTFAFAGRLVLEKGIPQLLTCWHDLHKAGYEGQLHIFGDGPLRGLVEEAAAANPLIKYHGRVGQQELTDALQANDVFILPTLQDNWSLALLEAANCGMALISTPGNGISRDLIRDDAGLVVSPESSELYKAVVSVLENPERVVNWRRAAYRNSRSMQTKNAVDAACAALAQCGLVTHQTT